jgi:16S rRNA processing protein RimM
LTPEPHGGEAPAPRADAAPGELSAGRVGRAHGLDGSFYVTRPKERLLTLGARIGLGGSTTTIVRRAGTAQHPIVRVEGIDDRAAAEAMRGAELTLDSAQAPPLGEGEWWAHELEGLAVTDGDRVLGEVTRLIELPSCEALEVRPAAGGAPLLVPMVRDAVRRVAVAEGRVEVDLEFLDLPPAPGTPSSGPSGPGRAGGAAARGGRGSGVRADERRGHGRDGGAA